MIKDLYKEITFEKYKAEKEIKLEEEEAAARTIQLKATYLRLDNYRNAFLRYIHTIEEKKNVIITFFVPVDFFPRRFIKRYLINLI